MQLFSILVVFFVLLLFIIIYSIIVALGKYHYVKSNNSDFRCNPMFILFADMFGVNSEENSKHCLKQMHKSNVDEHMEETKAKAKELQNHSEEIENKTNSIENKLFSVHSIVEDTLSSISGMFIGTIINFKKKLFQLQDLTKKILTTIMVFINVTNTGVKTGESVLNGPIIKTLKALCFDPDTLIKLASGEIVTMKDVKIGDIIENNSKVLGKVDVINHYDDFFYEIAGGHRNTKIYVTGTHLIFDKDKKRFIYVSDSNLSKQSNRKKKKFHCLITDDHIIQIGDHTFWDYEE
jgi:hypothetical protein